MSKLKYLIKRIFSMSYKKMFDTVNKVNKKNKKNRFLIFFDIVYCGIKYQAGYTDYYLFEMYNLNKEQRKTIITRGINNSIIKKYNKPEYKNIFNNKIEFNQRFEKYLNRDWFVVNENNFNEFKIFIKKHNKFIAKPVDGQCGVGIELIEIKKGQEKAQFNKLLENRQFLIEEVAIQCKEISELHPTSINTLRVVTLKGHVVTAYIRIGNKNKIVDNFNNEGLAAPINVKSGVIDFPAIDKHDHLFKVHPITKVEIVGFKVPKWESVIKLCEESSKVISEIGYIGWDVCVGINEVFLIEANEFPGHDIYQLPPHRTNGIGLYPAFKKVLEEEK